MGKTSNVLSPETVQSKRRLHCYITSSSIRSESGETFTRYGLCFKQAAAIVREVPDMSGNANRIKAFADKINRAGLSPLQLDDIIEDFVVSESIL